MKKKMWIVKREVMATTVDKALKGRGRVYEVSEADEKFQPEEEKKVGFANKK